MRTSRSLYIIATLLCPMLAALIFSVDNVRAASAQKPTIEFGVYDPYGDFADNPNIKVEHLFLPWHDIDLDSLARADEFAVKRNRRILLSVEPWSWSSKSKANAERLQQDLMSGKHDNLIRSICSRADQMKSPVTIRWAHEMDLKNRRFPWASWKPEVFIKAYRHFVDVCRSASNKLKFMWSPRGELGFEVYYPGSQYVDEIGVSVYRLQKQDNKLHNKDLRFITVFVLLYRRVAKFQKPITIAEYGCDGNVNFVRRCNPNMLKSLRKFPLLQSVVYFNEVETNSWPPPYGRPNWRSGAKYFGLK